MFSIKRSSGSSLPNIDAGTASSSSYGKIRTLKEDFENFSSGKTEEEEIPMDFPDGGKALPLPAKPELENKTPSPAAPPTSPPALKPAEKNPLGTPSFQVPQTNNSEVKKEIPNPFGSDNYFSSKSPFEEADNTPKPKAPDASSPKKSHGLALAILSAFIVLAILGGSFYYYWFFVKKPASPPASSSAETTQTKAPEKSSGDTSSNKSLRSFLVDPSAGSMEFQKSFQGLVSDFVNDSSENTLIEIRPVGKDGRQISVSDFMNASSMTFPATVTKNLSASDYGLFVKKENGEARAGIVLKLSDLTGVREELALEEKKLPEGARALYFGQALPATEPVFNPSKYKNADIRYYNFSSPENSSLDYSVIRGKAEGYLIIATSKNMMRSILDYMSEK